VEAREYLKLLNHLTCNAYPPIPADVIAKIAKTIDELNKGKIGSNLKMSSVDKGFRPGLTLGELILDWHLEDFLNAEFFEDVL
jgi:hypothetical protein